MMYPATVIIASNKTLSQMITTPMFSRQPLVMVDTPSLRWLRYLLVVWLMALGAQTALADTLLDYDASATSLSMRRLLIKEDSLRVDIDASNWLLFQRGQQAITFVDSADASYTVLDQATLAQLGAAISQAQAKLEAALAKLPSQQQAQMRELMHGALQSLMGDPGDLTITLQNTTETAQAAGIECQMTEVQRGAVLSNKVCLAHPAALNISAGDAAVFHAWTQFTQTMMEDLAQQAQGLIPFAAPSFGPIGDRLPIITEDNNGDRSELKRYSTDPLDPALFVIPDTYTRDELDISF